MSVFVCSSIWFTDFFPKIFSSEIDDQKLNKISFKYTMQIRGVCVWIQPGASLEHYSSALYTCIICVKQIDDNVTKRITYYKNHCMFKMQTIWIWIHICAIVGEDEYNRIIMWPITRTGKRNGNILYYITYKYTFGCTAAAAAKAAAKLRKFTQPHPVCAMANSCAKRTNSFFSFLSSTVMVSFQIIVRTVKLARQLSAACSALESTKESKHSHFGWVLRHGNRPKKKTVFTLIVISGDDELHRFHHWCHHLHSSLSKI